MKLISIGIACAALCACSPSGGSSKSSDQLSLSVESTAFAADAGAAPSGASVTRMRLSVSSLKLEGPAAGVDAGAVEINEGPFLVDLSGTALAGSIEQVFDTSVPAGSYREFSLTIAPSTTAVLGDLATKGDSLIIDGSFNGAPFSFTSKTTFTEKKEGTFTVGDGTGNITLEIDASTWFGTAAAPLDPSIAANAPAIEANILASFKAFRDDDRNGHDDDDADAGDDHGKGSADAGDDHGVDDAGDDHGHDDAGTADAGDDHGQHDGGDDASDGGHH
jgi:hypothetical protein